MSDDRSGFRALSVSRRHFLRGLAGLSLGGASIGGQLACNPRPAAAPRSQRLPLIAYFYISRGQYQADTDALLKGLEAQGYREGQTIRIERRQADNDSERWPATARELVDLHPDVIVLEGRPLVPLLLNLTQTIPVVVVLPQVGAEQLIESGWIRSQARPGGNLTGLVGTTSTLPGKRLDLLHEALPAATRLATLRDPSSGDPFRPYPEWASQVISLSVSRSEDLDAVFAQFEQGQVELLAVTTAPGGSNLLFLLDQVAEQTRRHRLPAVCDIDTFARNGGLMSYAADRAALFRGVGRFADKILKGTSPADLPVELPATFSLVVNKRTAGALGLTIPPAVLAQATEVLQ